MFMRSKRPRFVASALSCSIVALLVPTLALGAEPSSKAEAAPAASPPGSPSPKTAVDSGAPPSAEVMLEAKQRFDRGFELYEEGEYPLALIEFNRAYELVPNYRVLYNIGQVCIQLGQYANARRTLEEYLKKGGDGLATDRRAAVNKDLQMLGHRTAFLTVSANVEAAEILVDDVFVGKTPLGPALLVDAGAHRVTVRRAGYLPKTSAVTLAGGDEQALSVALEREPEDKPTIVVREREVVDDSARTWMIAGWVTTGALAAGAVVTGILGSKEADELKRLRGAYAPSYDDLPARIDKTKSNARTLFLASDVMSGAALVVGGLSLWITLDPPEPERSSEPAAPPPKLDKGLELGYADGQLQMRGSF
jgi:tetratricopeptide (TPR) repeat protein